MGTFSKLLLQRQHYTKAIIKSLTFIDQFLQGIRKLENNLSAAKDGLINLTSWSAKSNNIFIII